MQKTCADVPSGMWHSYLPFDSSWNRDTLSGGRDDNSDGGENISRTPTSCMTM